MKKVFCWGTFDQYHKGHEEFLRYAKSQGDYLVAIVIPDFAVKQNKGKEPRQAQHERAEALGESELVDEVIEGGNLVDNISRIISRRPDVWVFGYDQKTEMEELLKECLADNDQYPKYVRAEEMAGGVHTSNLSSNPDK